MVGGAVAGGAAASIAPPNIGMRLIHRVGGRHMW
jgi:hypothetical protein